MLNENFTEEATLDAINGNLVALCKRCNDENKTKSTSCLGYGEHKKQLLLFLSILLAV